jgi:hypothetical protein
MLQTIKQPPLVGDSLPASATTIPALNSDDLEVQGAKVHAEICPGLEVVLNSDCTANRAGFADRDVLVESRGAFDRRLVDALVLPDSVGGTITVHRTLLGASLGQVNHILHDIILD